MARTELGDKFGGVLCGIDGEGFGNGEKGGGKFANGKLFARSLNCAG